MAKIDDLEAKLGDLVEQKDRLVARWHCTQWRHAKESEEAETVQRDMAEVRCMAGASCCLALSARPGRSMPG